MRGIDISNWQAGLNISALDSSIEFICVKATGGNAYVDKTCDNFIQAAVDNNKLFGFYHFAYDGYGSMDAHEEANFFVDNCLNYFGWGIPILDLEHNAIPSWRTYTETFVNVVHERTGVWPLIYTGLEGLNRLHDSWVLDKCGIWFAGYPLGYIDYWLDDSPYSYYDLPINANIAIWQFTSAINIQGYNVDGNIAYMDSTAWLKYAIGDNIMPELTAKDVWAYKNKALERDDAYQILRDTRDMCKQLMKEIAALETEIAQLKFKGN